MDLPYSRPGAQSSREQVPLAVDAFQRPRAAVLEVDARAGGEVADDARDQHLTWSGLRGDPRADVHADALDLVADDLHLAGVDAGAQLEPKVGHRRLRPLSARDRPRRPVERREQAVAGAPDLPAAVARELRPHHG